ncbi:MAG: ABC transporter permease subunit [bacterium]|nr:ABC transporter permease subunit [bacterium]
MQLWPMIIDSLRHALDRKLFWVLVVITLLIAGAMLSVGFDGDRVSMLFGMIQGPADDFTPITDEGRTQLVGVVVHVIMDFFLGRVGITLMIIATAGLFPSFLEGGIVDTVLSKPIGRPRLFFYKYVAGMVFVLLQAALFAGLTFLVMGLRWGVWVPGYLLSIPLMVLLFSYVYCVSVLVAVISRSTVTAILISLGSWVVFSLVNQGPLLFKRSFAPAEYPTLHRAVQIASWIPPKTAEVIYLAARWADAGTSAELMPDAVVAAVTEADRSDLEEGRLWEEARLRGNPLVSIGTSLLFEVFILLLAMWKFTRMDF